MQMARRLTSYIDLRNVAPRIPQQPVLVHHRRRQGDRVPAAVHRAGTASSSSTTSTVVKRYLAYFDEVWAGSLIQPELRATAIDF